MSTTSTRTVSSTTPQTTTTRNPINLVGSIKTEQQQPKVTSVPEDHSLRGAAIGFSIVMVIAIAIGGLVLYRKVQRNRYRNQEFLLNDNVFRYNGYAQVGTP
jgi:uncharacterized protein HemX